MAVSKLSELIEEQINIDGQIYIYQFGPKDIMTGLSKIYYH